MNPTLAGFQAFITSIMQIPASVLNPASSPFVVYAFNVAMNTVNDQLTGAPCFDITQPNIYAVAVYNLAADVLINYAMDPPSGPAYFATLRQSLGINGFTGGIITSTSDNGTSSSFSVPETVQGLSIGQLQNLRTPYGRQYLAIAASVGTNWGIT